MFARATTRIAARTGARSSRSFSAQAGARVRSGNNLKLVAGVTAVAATMFAWQTQFNQEAAVCEPAPSPQSAAGSIAEPKVKNCAFVFIKPHAVTDSTKGLVAEGLKAKGVNIISEGTITAEEIDKGMLIDTHYYAIASKATLLKPNQLNVPADKFEKQFGLGWQEALDKGVVYNAMDACELLGVDAAGLNKAWAACKKGGKLVKFGGGFYCGLVDTIPGKEPIYVFNGFFMNMRSSFVKPGTSIYYYSVEWDAAKLSWEDFRGKVLGPTDPEEAPKDSLRGLIMNDWAKLGLAYRPNVGDNGVHASASPFEGLAERLNWLGASVASDPFGQKMLEAGVPEATIKDWSVDPQVTYGSPSMPIKGSLFDSLEDTDADVCVARCMMINAKVPETPYVKLGAAFAGGAVLGAIASSK